MEKVLILFLLIFISLPAFPQENPKTTIAIIDFKALGVSASESTFVTEFFRNAVVISKGFKVVDKANMDKILIEQGFQNTGCTTQECAVQMGKILNVQKMVTGNYGKLGELHQITINLVDVETGEIVYSDVANCKQTEDLYETTTELATRMIKNLIGKTRPITETKVSTPQPIPETGSLTIITDPPESTVFIDGFGEKTDDFGYLYKKLKSNVEHVIKVTHSGYKNNEQILKINPDEKRTLTFKLELNSSEKEKIDIKQEPDNQTKIDYNNWIKTYEYWVEKYKDNKGFMTGALIFIGAGGAAIVLEYLNTGSVDSFSLLFGAFAGVGGSITVAIGYDKKKKLEEIGKKNGWTLSMNRGNELKLAYNIYLE